MIGVLLNLPLFPTRHQQTGCMPHCGSLLTTPGRSEDLCITHKCSISNLTALFTGHFSHSRRMLFEFRSYFLRPMDSSQCSQLPGDRPTALSMSCVLPETVQEVSQQPYSLAFITGSCFCSPVKGVPDLRGRILLAHSPLRLYS